MLKEKPFLIYNLNIKNIPILQLCFKLIRQNVMINKKARDFGTFGNL